MRIDQQAMTCECGSPGGALPRPCAGWQGWCVELRPKCSSRNDVSVQHASCMLPKSLCCGWSRWVCWIASQASSRNCYLKRRL